MDWNAVYAKNLGVGDLRTEPFLVGYLGLEWNGQETPDLFALIEEDWACVPFVVTRAFLTAFVAMLVALQDPKSEGID